MRFPPATRVVICVAGRREHAEQLVAETQRVIAPLGLALSGEAKTRMRREMRRWGVARRSDKTLTDLALMFNRQLQGWINYYGRFYKSMLYPVFRHLNEILVRWAMRKYKRLRRHTTNARRFIADIARRQPGLFAHWRFGVRPDGWTMGAR